MDWAFEHTLKDPIGNHFLWAFNYINPVDLLFPGYKEPPDYGWFEAIIFKTSLLLKSKNQPEPSNEI